MYLEHFGLREAPFRITPHTEFFFSGANRGATLEALIYAITRDEGLVKGRVEGESRLLKRQLERRFGPLPQWVSERLGSAKEEELETWSEAVLTAPTLDAVFEKTDPS